MKNKELREKSKKELLIELDKLKKEVFSLRMKKVASHLENPLKLRLIRKDIARLNTMIHEKDLEAIKDKLN